jgi:hypothetical protein
MTSEVLILNKRGVVLGADSAVTTSGASHPRYSKSATKIFELASNGSVAATIFGGALVDLVPWELAIKLFRTHLGNASFARVSEYGSALSQFLSGNEQLFPGALRTQWIEGQFDEALKLVLQEVRRADPSALDENLPLADRQARWVVQATQIRALLQGMGTHPSLSQVHLANVLANLAGWTARAQSQIDLVPSLAGVSAADLAELGHLVRYSLPDSILSGTGVVVAGYGSAQIFPAYQQLMVYGHIGDELSFKEVKSFEVTHGGIAMIQPFAKTSMIEMFTDGFSPSLEQILEKEGRRAMESVFAALGARGIQVPQADIDAIVDQCHTSFMKDWKRENWKQNFNPLVEVLQTLSIQEMAHLAESLLGLESLKERVTSPTETVGGPIDVAAITKSEGLVWIKRKHYFDAELNMRYAARLNRSFQ